MRALLLALALLAGPAGAQEDALRAAEALMAQGRAADAAARLDPALIAGRGGPDHGQLARAAFRARLEAGDAPAAIRALREAIEADPEGLRAGYGTLYAELGERAEAARQAGEDAQVPALIAGQLALAETYLPVDTDLGLPGGLAQARRNVVFSRGMALDAQGKSDAALREFRVWVGMGPLTEEERADLVGFAEILVPVAAGETAPTTPDDLHTIRLALLFAEASGADPTLLGRAMIELATAERWLGQPGEARTTLARALEVLNRSPGTETDQAQALRQMAGAAAEMGDGAAATAALDRLDALRAAGTRLDPLAEAEARADRASLALAQGAVDGARAQVAEGLATLDAAPSETEPSTLLIARAQLLSIGHHIDMEAGLPLDLRPILKVADALRRIDPQALDLALVLANIADTAAVTGDMRRARKLLTEALAIATPLLPETAPLRLDAREKLAQFDLIAGAHHAARVGYEAVNAARRHPALREGLRDAAGGFALQTWLQLTAPVPDVAAAFETVQWTHLGRPAEAVRQLEARLGADDPIRQDLMRRRQDALAVFEGAADPAARRAANDALAALDSDLSALGFEAMGLGSPRPVMLAEVQALLGPGEMLVTWALPGLVPGVVPGVGASSNRALAVTADAVHVGLVAEPGRGALRDKVAQLRCAVVPGGCAGGVQGTRGSMSLEAGPIDTSLDVAHALYLDLFGGLGLDLAAAERLILVPPPDLTDLPFAALLTGPAGTDLSQAPWLLRRSALSILPSIPSLRALRASPPPRPIARMLGVGDPIIGTAGAADCSALQPAALRGAAQAVAPMTGALADPAVLAALPRLADAACELRAIAAGFGDGATLALGPDAREGGLKALDARGELASYDALVFATHGLVAGEVGVTSPGLVLTPPATATAADDGLLTAAEIATLSLDAALVVLSACNTAAGEGDGAEGLSGLARAFVQAGARGVVVTQWSVYSAAAVDLSTGLFAALRADPGLSQAAALRRAALSILDDPARPAWQHHPSYWAPFTLVGAS